MESILMGAIGLGSIAAPALIALVGVRPAIVITGLVLPVAVALTGRWLVRLDVLPAAVAANVKLLLELTLFAPLSEPALEQIAVNLRPVSVAAGTEVGREGDHGDEFYIVEQGALAVTVGGVPAMPIHSGGFFGEIALLRDTPRTATVTATTDCALVALDAATGKEVWTVASMTTRQGATRLWRRLRCGAKSSSATRVASWAFAAR